MIVNCPQCRTRVMLNSQGICPACRKIVREPPQQEAYETNIHAGEVATAGPVVAEIVDEGGKEAKQEQMESQNEDVVIRGRRRGLLSILSSGIVLALLGIEMLSGGANALTFGFAIFVLGITVFEIRLLLFPPRIAVQDGRLDVQGIDSFTVPIDAVNNVRFVNRQVSIVLQGLGQVEPEQMRTLLKPKKDGQGIEYRFPPSVFSAEQLGQLRGVLGLSSSDADIDPASVFDALLREMTPRAFITPALVAVNVAIFLVLKAINFSDPEPWGWTLLDWGANFAPLTTRGEWWRLFTSLFLHANLIHLAFNAWVLWDVGRLVERLVGNLGFAVVYAATGFSGSLTSVLWHRDVISVGASGAIFGLFGVLLGFLVLQPKTLPTSVVKEHRSSILTFVAVNLVFGFSIRWIDMAAHVGGFGAGLVCGLALSHNLSPCRRAARGLRTGLLAMACLGVVLLTIYVLPARSTTLSGHFVRLDLLDHWTEKTLSRLSFLDRRTADRVELEMLPHFQTLQRAAARIEPGLDELAYTNRVRRYGQLRINELMLIAESVKTQDLARFGRSLETHDEARALFPTGDAKFRPRGAREKKLTTLAALARMALEESRGMDRFAELASEQWSPLPSQAVAASVEEEILPSWREAMARLRRTRGDLPAEDQPQIDRYLSYLQLRENSWKLLLDSSRTGDKAKYRESQSLWEKAEKMAPTVFGP